MGMDARSGHRPRASARDDTSDGAGVRPSVSAGRSPACLPGRADNRVAHDVPASVTSSVHATRHAWLPWCPPPSRRARPGTLLYALARRRPFRLSRCKLQPQMPKSPLPTAKGVALPQRARCLHGAAPSGMPLCCLTSHHWQTKIRRCSWRFRLFRARQGKTHPCWCCLSDDARYADHRRWSVMNESGAACSCRSKRADI